MTLTRVVVVTGAGGVGKSTFAAALAARHAEETDTRVLLITVDPARRLASSMGVVAEGNEIVRVESDGPAFSVSMLDTRLGWDSLVRRVAPSPAVAERVLSNALYRNITGRFVNSHDYIAVERLWEVTRSGLYDVVIVDTPPSRNALSVIDAAERMREFFASRLLRWLTLPASNRLVAVTSRPFFAVADRVLGSRFLSDVSEFFALFRVMEPTFTSHARDVETLLRDESTEFLVVTTAEPAPVTEAHFLAGELAKRGLHLSAVVVNRMLDDETKLEASRLGGLVSGGDVQAAVDEIRATVEREEAACRDLEANHGCRVVRVSEAQEPVNDVRAVRLLARRLGALD